MMSRHLSPAQAAEYLGTSPRTIRELIQAGRLPAIDISTIPGRHRFRVAADDLARFAAVKFAPAESPRRRRPRRLPPVKKYV